MTVSLFKEKCGYEIEGVWFPRVTSITDFSSRAWYGMREAAEWGALIHEAIERILKGEEGSLDPRLSVTMETFMRWHKVYPLHIRDPKEDIEVRLVDAGNGYAGTADIIAEVEGALSIIDLKTSTNMAKAYGLQTAAYLAAYNAMHAGERPCEKRWILRIDQYQECLGCLAKLREKYGRARLSGGKSANWRRCNHQWSQVKGELEFRELKGYERDLERFFELKERWEWANKEWLSQIPNCAKNIRQPRRYRRGQYALL